MGLTSRGGAHWNCKAKGQSQSSGGHSEGLLGWQMSAFPPASMCYDVTILCPSSVLPDPVLGGQWHCPEVAVSLLEGEEGVFQVSQHWRSTAMFTACIRCGWNKQEYPSHMPEKSYWTQELRKQQWVKSSGLSSILSFPLFGSGHPLWNLWE